MKKFSAGLLCLLLLLALAACGGQTPATEPATEPPRQETTTLMIYMIGSDLEAKGGAGTNDLEEMQESGVDLQSVNVLVYAGGSKKWHNDVADKEVHTLMQLQADGFHQVTTMPAASMGEAASLSAFLNYSYQHFPADRYALVLWDHGDGPVIGYGKDMLYGNDSLTLQEMQQAMAETPFGTQQKLDWVGFDACLMASAELACVWDDYADYLVASQEIEPAFGWNYDFLAQLGKQETPALLEQVTQSYLAACQAYYERKDYDNRDTTLACMDLSGAAAVESAINGLFAKAAGDVTEKYDFLTAQRVETRALGRASTGSEYDLVDLGDMAQKLSLLYPEEAQALLDAISAMVVANATNVEGLCGMSLFYPFYNKPYYERDWNAVYTQLGMFPEYQGYLQQYAAIWTASDKLETVAQSVLPSAVEQGVYALELTPEQAQSYADARYFIFTRDGEGLYTPVFVSRNISKNDTVLTANFDGKVLYAKNKFNQYVIPVSTEHDTVGHLTHYSAYVSLTNAMADWSAQPENFNRRSDGHRFHLTVNRDTGEVKLRALVPYDVEMDAGSLMGGKTEDADLSQYSKYIFMHERHRYLTRYENGVICPVVDWPASSYHSGVELPIGDGLEFLMAPLVSGEYYLCYEIEDTQGNRYCSELLPITAQGQLEPEYYPEDIEVSWESGDDILLFDRENVAIYLEKLERYGEYTYTYRAENRNDFDVTVWATDLYVNGTIYCHDGYAGQVTIPAGQTLSYEYGFDFGAVDELGYDVGMESLLIHFMVSETIKDTTMVKTQAVYVNFSEQTTLAEHEISWWGYGDYGSPVRGMKAESQVLAEDAGLRLTLMGLGSNDKDTSLRGCILVENNGDTIRHLQLDGLVFEDIYIPLNSNRISLYPGVIAYDTISIDEEDLNISNIHSVRNLQAQLRIMAFDTLQGGGGFSQYVTYPVTLSLFGEAPTFAEGEQLLLEEKGIRVALKTVEDSIYDARWYLTVVNDTDQAISLQLAELYVNGEQKDLNRYYDVGLYESQVGPRQKCVSYLSYFGDWDRLENIQFRFRVMDFAVETILYQLETVVELKP